ncbi:MAG TPA: YfhO family protein [Thermoanaerobaculia bacterium]|nr:YfhO family protein [Thermoanaerobaculia bacterium]
MFNPTWFYAGAVYAGAVALARRAGIDIPKRVAFFFYALVFVFMFLPLTNDYVNLPVDFLKTLPPWAYTLPPDQRTAARPEMNDVALQIVPWAHQVRESWRAFRPPLWNHLSAAGYPLLASAQSSALSPLRLLGLPLSLAHAMTFEAAMKVLVALTFTFLWCRRRGYSELASVTGAVAFGFSTFIIVWLHFPLITTACLVPAVFYLIDLLAERTTWPRFLAGAVVWTLMLFGGHPETVSHTFFIALLYILWIVAVERGAPWRLFLTLGGALAISGLLAAPLLVPFAEAVTKSKRYYELQKNPLTAEVPFSDWPSARLLLQPFESWGPSHAESVTGFAGYLGVAAWIALAIHVVRRKAWRSREMFFLLATVLVVGIILSWPGVSELFHVIFRLAANARLRLFLALFMAVQTAAVVDLIPRDRRSVLIGVAIAAAVLLGVFFTTDTAAFSPMIPSLAVLVVAASAALVRRHDLAVLLVLVAVTAEMWSAARSWAPDISQEWMYPKTPLLRALDEAAAKVPPNEPFRIVGSGPAFFPNVSAVYGYEDIRAHDPMANGNYIRLLSLVIGYDEDNYFAEWNEWEKHFTDFLNVRYVLTTWKGELPPRFRLLYDGDDGRLFENTEVLPRFYPVRNVILEFRDDEFDRRLQTMEDWSQTALLDKLELEEEKQRGDFFNPRPLQAPLATVEILEAKPSDYRLHVKAPRYSLVASSVPWWPGWKVLRNGARIEPLRVNGGFLGFVVPEGEVDVRIWYDPWTFRFGAIIAAVTIAALVAYGVWRKPEAEPA